MIHWVARGLAGLTAAYEGIIGLLLVVSPSAGGAAYQLTGLTPVSAALSRLVGGLMVSSALMLAAFAIRPAANPWLAPLLAAGCVINVAAGASACAAGEIHWRQVLGSLTFQTVLGGALIGHLSSVRAARRRSTESPAALGVGR